MRVTADLRVDVSTGRCEHQRRMNGKKDRHVFEQWVSGMPWVARWVRQCMACGRQGMAPDAPEKFLSSWWDGRLDRLRLDESGLCEACAAAQDRTRT
jgi:hypothetical protein